MTTPTTPERRSTRTPLVVAAVAVVLALVVVLVTTLTGGPDEPDAGAGDDRPAATADGAAATEGAGDDDAAATGGADQPASPGVTYPATPEDNLAAELERRDPQDPMALGEPDAPVVMIIYSDFQCPFCRSWAQDTKPELQRFVDDGTLRLEWRDFPYLGPESSLAALAGRAAADQDMFWEFHDEVYEQDFSPNNGAITPEALEEWAGAAGLDADGFAEAINTTEHQEQVFADRDEGVAVGVTGTPAFLVNGVPIIGAQPTPTFVQAVEDAAAAAQG